MVSLDDIKILILQSEERIMSRLDDIASRVTNIEAQLTNVQTEQIRLGMDVSNVKDIIIKQQHQIESLEADKRLPNLIFSGIKETEMNNDGLTLRDDAMKIQFLCNEMLNNFEISCIDRCVRLGKPQEGHNRLLRVTFNDVKIRNQVLSYQKHLRDNDEVKELFGIVYVNPDHSFLMQKEQKRLRELAKEKRNSADPNDRIYIKSGKLYHNSNIIDQVNIANQLF